MKEPRGENTAAADLVVRPDLRLIGKAKRGNRRALTKLYADYSRAVHAVLLARVPSAEADDLTQDVFVLAMRRLPELRDDQAFPSWLMTIARNRATDYWKQNRETQELKDVHAAPNAPLAEARQVLEHVKALPEAYRETLLMRLVGGMSAQEIAAKTGLTAGSVRVNLHRGMKLLREVLGGSDD